MMQFRSVKDALKTILIDSAADRYRVIGFQRQEKASSEFTNNNRMVEVFFKNENFNLSRSRLNGPVGADVIVAIELTVSAEVKVDLSALESEFSTPAEKMAALAGMKEASNEADDSFDELAEIIYQIVMDARNIDLGLPDGDVANRWVGSIDKNDPNPRGELVVLTGSLEFTCKVSEDVPGDTGVPADSVFLQTEIKDDPVQKTAVEVKY